MKIRVVLPYGSATVGCSFYTSARLRHQIREGEVFYVKRRHGIKFNYPSFIYLGTKKDELSLVKTMQSSSIYAMNVLETQLMPSLLLVCFKHKQYMEYTGTPHSSSAQRIR